MGTSQSSYGDRLSAYSDVHVRFRRDEHVLGTYEFTCQLATLEPPPPMQQMFGAIHGNQPAMDAFAQMNAGTISPAEFGAIVAAAHGPA